MVSCQVSVLQLVSLHVIENLGDQFKKFRTDFWRVVGLHQILAGNIITCLEPLRLGLTVTEINRLHPKMQLKVAGKSFGGS